MIRFRRAIAGVLLMFVTGLALLVLQHRLQADATPQPVPFAQNWTNKALLTANDNWSGVPGIVGHRGDDLTTATGTDPQTILADGTGTPQSVFANQTSGTFGSGGIAEFDGIPDPTIAIQGSGTADAPFVLITLNTTGFAGLTVSYNLRDLDPSIDDAVQQVALHYRLGTSGPFTNIAAAYVPDATDGGTATRVTPVATTLPAEAENQPLVQLRVMTTNAVGNDEWVGIDDIDIVGMPSGPTNPTAVGAAVPAFVLQGHTTVLTITVTPGMNPASTVLTATADLSAIEGPSSTAFFDDGVFPDAAAGDNVFSFFATIPPSGTTGVKVLPFTVGDAQGRSAAASITLEVVDPTPPPAVSIEPLPFLQDWSVTSLITSDDNWSNVPGIGGYLGAIDPGAPTGVDPQTIVSELASFTVDAVANATNTGTPDGGVAEFELANPTIALQGSGTADAPNIVINVSTLGLSSILVSYNLRDLDDSADDAVQPVALQYRVGSFGDFMNVPGGFVADATLGPNAAGLVTPVSVLLPPDANNHFLVQVRIITTNAAGSDEWVGIDDISVAPTSTSPTGSGSAWPISVMGGETTLFQVFVTPGTNPDSTGLIAVIDLTAIGGSSALPLVDDGTQGDVGAGDGLFSLLATVAPGTVPGLKLLPVTVSDGEGRNSSTAIELEILPPPTPPSGTGAATPNPVFRGQGALLTVSVLPGANPASSAIVVNADLSAIGGAASQMLFDNGTNGDVTAGDLVYSLRYVVPVTVTSGLHPLSFSIGDGEGRSGAGSIGLSVLDPPATVPPLPFTQNWANVTLITSNDNWSLVPGIVGYLGDYTASSPTGVDPQTLTSDMSTTAVDVIANQSNVAISNGGVAEFDAIADPTIALQGSGTADAPHIVLSLDTGGFSSVTVGYSLRDIDDTADNAIQAVALQYRIGSSGDFTNVPAAFVADATSGPGLATLVTPVSVQLPGSAANQPLVQLRILTTNAGGNDEWVGIDDITVTGSNDPTTPSGVGSATPGSVEAGATSVLTVAVTPGINPTSTALGVAGDLATIGGSSQQMFFDDGTNGDQVAGDNVFTYTATVAASTSPGPKSIPVTVSDAQFRSSVTTVALAVLQPALVLTISEIQGAGSVSPHSGRTVRTRGIVTGRKTNGFFLQSETGDGDPATSDGIFVFTGSAPPASAAAGHLVEVTAVVQEFVPSADPIQPPLTELTSNPAVTLLSSGHPLPAAVLLVPADMDPAGPLENLERYEGMRVEAASLTVVAPTQGNLVETTATSTSSGVFYGVLTGLARPFREPGVQVPDPLPAGAPLSIPRFDGNPERLRVDADGIGGEAVDVAAGQVLTGVAGPLDYGFRTYTILPDPGSLASPPAITPTAVSVPTANQFTIGSANLQRFFDTVNDPLTAEPILSAAAFSTRLNKASLLLRDVMRAPDIIGVVEVENLAALQALAARLNADTVAAGQPDPQYVAYLEEGNDVGGIDVGLLVKSSKVTVLDVVQIGADQTFVDPTDGSVDLLNDRPPLLLRAEVANPPGGAAFPITAIVNHLRSLNDIADPSAGARVRAKRRAQAEFLAQLIQERQVANPDERIISVGDFNAFEFSDGYVDVIGTIKGTPAETDAVVLASPDLVNPNLIDLVDTVPASNRYSYSFDGNAQVLDHATVTDNLLAHFDGLEFGRVNADFPEIARNQSDVPTRLSDHDPLVVYFSLPQRQPTLTTIASSLNPASFGQPVTFTATVSSTGNAVSEGFVTFREGTVPLGPPVLLSATGQAVLLATQSTVGDHIITAEYAGTANFGSSSQELTQSIVPTLSIDDVTVTEGDTGSAAAVFTVSLVPASPQTVSVFYATGSGSATAGEDFVAQGLTPLTFLPGETATAVTIVITGDLLNELDEIFTVNLSGATNAAIADGEGTGTIVNDDAPRITAFSPSSGAIGSVVTIAGSGFSGITSVRFNGIASAFTVLSSTEISAVVPASATDGPIAVASARGTAVSSEVFYVVRQLGIADVALVEGHSGTKNAAFRVRLSGLSTRQVSVDFSTADETAVAGQDYAAASGTLTFPPGTRDQFVSVVVNGDTTAELNQTFRVNLSGAVNATLGDSAGRGTIINDDRVRVSINNAAVDEPTAGQVTAAFLVRLSALSELPITVGYQTVDVTATAGADYRGIPAVQAMRLEFAPGDTEKTIDVAVLPDAIPERTERFRVVLSEPVNATLSDATARGTIFDRNTPRIDAFAPAAAAAGSPITITGQNFFGVTGVRFGRIAASFSVASATQISAVVPPNAVEAPISVANAIGTATSTAAFQPLPVISGFSPTSGIVGRIVTISGSGLAGTTEVQFNGISSAPIALSASTVRVAVPIGATTGVIRVLTSSGSATSPAAFRVLPRIEGFAPMSGPAGTSVTIAGSNLAGGAVRFGNVAATVVSSGYASIVAVAPPGLPLSARISVTTADGTATSTDRFTRIVTP